MKKWCCKSCGYIHSGTNSPMKCPQCQSSEDSFEYRALKKDDYLQLRKSQKTVSNNADLIVIGSRISAFVAAITASIYGATVIMLEPEKSIGGSDTTGFSESEKNAAFSNLKRMQNSVNLENISISEYDQVATSMLRLLASKDLLPEFKNGGYDPMGNPHPWGDFSESQIVDESEKSSPEVKRTLKYSLAHWATDNGVRILLNHPVSGLDINDNNEIVGVKTLFNDKPISYNASVGVISFLENDFAGNSENSSNSGFFHQVQLIPEVKPSSSERNFWGDSCCIGPSMVKSYSAITKLMLDNQSC